MAAVAVAVLRSAPGLAKKRSAPPLFYEGFRRSDREGWGWPWFNQRYGRHWAIKDRRGIYRLPPSDNGPFFTHYRPAPLLVIDHDVANVSLSGTFSMSNRTARVGFVARTAGYSDFYAIYVGAGDRLRVSRCGHHTQKVLRKARYRVEPNRRFHMKARVTGSGPVRIRAKVWPAGQPEPRGWMIDAQDSSSSAYLGAGPFGIFTGHAVDRKRAVIRVAEFVARSSSRPRKTPPSITYSLAGPVHGYGAGKKARVVAQTLIPAQVRFRMGREPTLTQDVVEVPAGRSDNRARTARAELSLGAFGTSSLVYWQPVARRSGVTVAGPISSFRTPPAPGLPVRFAFGSCTRFPPSPRHSFEQARKLVPDFYLHQGDLGYATHQALYHAADSYQDVWTRMLLDRHLAGMTREVPFAFFQDDEDYGRNGAHRSSLRRFTIRAWDEMTANPAGPYFSFRHGDVMVFKVDCRRFSTGKEIGEKRRSKLGSEQKKWLLKGMTTAANNDNVSLIVVASPQSFGSDKTPGSWRRAYAEEWSELIDFFQSLGVPVLIVSGDAHGHRLHEYPQKNLQPHVPRIVEFTSSGTEQNKWNDDFDEDILVHKAKGSGFGLVDLGPEQTVAGVRGRILTLSAVASHDGSPFWVPRQYLVVRNLGILPLA